MEWLYNGYKMGKIGARWASTTWHETHLWKCSECGDVITGELKKPEITCPKCGGGKDDLKNGERRDD